MGHFVDMSGEVINSWKILSFSHLDKHHASVWNCECQLCHKTVKKMRLQVIRKSKNCGCDKIIDLTNKHIGFWTVLEKVADVSYLKYPRKTWKCVCECGTIRNISETKLINNKNEMYSCGCKNTGKERRKRGITPNKIIEHDDYIEILMVNGKHSALIDKEDWDILSNDSWTISHDGYAVSSSGNNVRKRMHRVIMKCVEDKNVIIDHINRNKLDNRKKNLRIVTDHENGINQSKRKDNKTGITGVVPAKRKGAWKAQIKYDYKNYSLGVYDNFDDAVKARLEGELKYFGIDFSPQKDLFEAYGVNSQ